MREAVAEPTECAANRSGLTQWDQVATKDEHVPGNRHTAREFLAAVAVELKV
jgi:hypothetical protein